MRHAERCYQLLIVDDDPIARKVYGRLLAEVPSNVCEMVQAGDAATALAALAARRTYPFDCVLLDFYLPDMTGCEFLTAAAVDGALPCAVVLITGQGNETIAVEAMKLGAQDYLAKDKINASNLWRAITNAVTQTELHQMLARSQRQLSEANDGLEKANRAKTRFLTGMSHEMRTPLHGIIGYAELLKVDGGLNPTQDARVDAMLVASHHLLRMIARVLSLSEIEAGHTQMQAIQFDAQVLMAECLDLVRPAAEVKGLALSSVVAPDIPRELVADPMRLRQVLLNLLGNAVKFTAQGAIELRLRFVAGTSTLRIEVSDTGPGIPAEQRQRLFQDFERLDTEATLKAEGAGLGLALSGRLAVLMGGRLGHDDNPGGGSVFWLELPSLSMPATLGSTSPQPEDVLNAEPTPIGTLQVLVVDDVLMNRDIAASFLSAAGHNVTSVQGGAEAVAAVASIDFDVVLMDIRMPEVDGLEATRRIRTLHGARGRVPIVAVTAQAFTEQISECRTAGMDSHLAKPFDPDTLTAAIVRAIGAASNRREAAWCMDRDRLKIRGAQAAIAGCWS